MFEKLHLGQLGLRFCHKKSMLLVSNSLYTLNTLWCPILYCTLFLVACVGGNVGESKVGSFFRGVQYLFQSHSKGRCKDPNDCMNHPK